MQKQKKEKPDHEILADEAAKDAAKHPASGATSKVAGGRTPVEHHNQVNIREAPMPEIDVDE